MEEDEMIKKEEKKIVNVTAITFGVLIVISFAIGIAINIALK